MSSHSDINEQLVIELYVRDFEASCAFYQAFGFRMVRYEGDFAELQWEDALLFLEAISKCTITSVLSRWQYTYSGAKCR